MTIIDLSEIRIRREKPDGEFVREDEYGRPVYCYVGEYDMDDGVRRVDIWAYNLIEARRCAAAMGNVKVVGQMYACVPA